jgi:hypothetical protein
MGATSLENVAGPDDVGALWATATVDPTAIAIRDPKANGTAVDPTAIAIRDPKANGTANALLTADVLMKFRIWPTDSVENRFLSR